MNSLQGLLKLNKEVSMSTSTEYAQILAAIGKLSDEVHSLSKYLTRLDERVAALDSKVDTRVSGVEIQVKTLESRVQMLVDKCQDIEIRLNRITDSHKELVKDFEAGEASKRTWFNRFVIPLLLMGAASAIGSLIGLNVGK